MMDERELRRKKLLDSMSNSLKPLSTSTVDPNMSTPVNAHPPAPTPANISTLPPDAGLTLPPVADKPVRVSASLGGLSDLERAGAVLQAKRQAGPSSPIRVLGDEVITDAPKMHTGGFKDRFKQFAKNAVVSAGEYARTHPDASIAGMLGAGATGGTIAAVKPVTGDEMLRRAEIQHDEGDLARQTTLARGQADVAGQEAETRQRELAPILAAEKIRTDAEVENAKLEIERQKAAGLITDREARRRQAELDRASREKTNAATNEARIKAAEITSGQRGQETPAALGERTRKAEAARAELGQLTADEATAGEQKNAAYEALKQFRADHPQMSVDEAGVADQMEQEAQRLNTLYQGYATKKSEAQRRLSENSGPTTSASTPNYSGRTMSTANLAKYASDKGLSVEEARKQVEAQGVKVQ